jgi:hypothetical protein
VTSARCGFFLDLTDRRAARCALPVSGMDMSIRVAVDSAGDVALTSEDALVVAADAERRLADALRGEYGEPFTVECPGPRLRVIPLTQTFACAIDAPDIQRTVVDVKPYGIDRVARPEVEHIPRRFERIFGRDVAERRSGGVSVSGRAVEAYVRGTAAAEMDGEIARRGLLGAVHCPAVVALRAREHARCTAQVGNRVQVYDMRFDEGRGVEIESQQMAIVVPALTEVAQRYYERPSSTGGAPVRVVVDCGRDVVKLVEPGASVPCTVTTGAAERNIVLKVLDTTGTFTFVDAED